MVPSFAPLHLVPFQRDHLRAAKTEQKVRSFAVDLLAFLRAQRPLEVAQCFLVRISRKGSFPRQLRVLNHFLRSYYCLGFGGMVCELDRMGVDVGSIQLLQDLEDAGVEPHTPRRR